MARKGERGDLKKFGFATGLRAADILTDLLILAFNTETMEGAPASQIHYLYCKQDCIYPYLTYSQIPNKEPSSNSGNFF